jgi:hypothetical protein
MLEKPRNFEEAKMIIKNSANDELEVYNRKKNIKRSAIISAICFASAAAIGLLNHRMSTFYAALPLASMVSLTSLFPLIYNRSVRKKIESGKAFEGRTEQEIIDAASSYVDEYNKFAKSQKIK